MLFSSLNFSIAISFLRLKKLEGIIALFSLIGIILGVTTLIVVTSVMNGFYIELQKQVIGIGGHIEIINNSQNNDSHHVQILSFIDQFSEIECIIPTIQKESLISNQYSTLSVVVKGLTLEDFKRQKRVLDKILSGRIEDFEQGIMIGNQIANLLGLSIGDEVKIIVPEFTNTIVGQMPRIKTYKVAAIFSLGMYEHDLTTVYMPFKFASKIYKTDIPNFYEIYLKNDKNVERLAQNLRNILKLPLYSWKEKQSSYFNALQTEKSVMFIILSLIVVMASFNIISTLIVLVEDKKKSIAVLRTMGITKFSIIRIFITCGTIIGIIGTLIGVILGLISTYYINEIRLLVEKISGKILFEPGVYIFNDIPTLVIFSDILRIVLLSLVAAFLSTIIPAMKAAETSPAIILKHE